MASCGVLPSFRSASSAKSIIMIAFFLTMPISRMMPISAITLRSVPAEQQRQQRADAGRGQRRENRDRMDVAFVQHAEHDVDGDERGENQQRLVGQRCLKRLRPCLESSPECWPASRSRASPVSIAFTASPSETPGARLNDSVIDGKLALMIDRKRRGGLSSECA